MAGQDIEALERAAATHPNDAMAFATLAAAYAEADRLDDAAEAFEHAAALAPDTVDIQLGLAAVQHARGDDPAVEAAVQRAVELDPNHPGVWLTIYEVSDPDENLNDQIAGAARYIVLAGDTPEAATLRDELVDRLGLAGDRIENVDADDPEELEWCTELAAILPYAREALPASVVAPLEARIRAARARLVAGAALASQPTTPAAAVLAHEAALPGLEEALAELKSAAELAPLDAASTGLVATLATRQAEARAQLAHAQLDDLTHRLFEAVADAETALTEGRHDDALAGFQDALLQIAELGDDAAPPYQIAAAMAYQGLAHAVAATPPPSPTMRTGRNCWRSRSKPPKRPAGGTRSSSRSSASS